LEAQVRAPPIVSAEIVVPRRLALAVTAPAIELPVSVTPAVLASSVTAPSIVFGGHDGPPIRAAKWLQHGRDLAWRAPVASLNVLLTSTCWRNDNNGFSHQGPGLIDTVIPLSGNVVRVYLPPDANCLLWTADHCLRSRDYVNLVVIDKQPELQYLDVDAAREHCARGASHWEWAGNAMGHEEADVILACIGDVPTQETIAAAALLREHVPELRFRVINVVDLMAIAPATVHPHAMSRERFETLFGESTDVICAFHGYACSASAAARPSERRSLPRPRLQRAGHDDDAVRHGRPQRDEPLPPRAQRAAPRAPARTGSAGARAAVRSDARAPPRLHPRTPRGHARGARLDLAASGLDH
jgi:hypothetical protein